MRDAYITELQEESNDSEPEETFGAGFSWMCYWYSSLYVALETYSDIGEGDPVIDALLAHPADYQGLLRRFRNGVFHFQKNPADPKLISLLAAGEDHAIWIQALHHELKRYFSEQIDSFGNAEVVAELRHSIHSLTGWLPDHPERRELDDTLSSTLSLSI